MFEVQETPATQDYANNIVKGFTYATGATLVTSAAVFSAVGYEQGSKFVENVLPEAAFIGTASGMAVAAVYGAVKTVVENNEFLDNAKKHMDKLIAGTALASLLLASSANAEKFQANLDEIKNKKTEISYQASSFNKVDPDKTMAFTM